MTTDHQDDIPAPEPVEHRHVIWCDAEKTLPPDVRHQVLAVADLRCEDCGVEHGRSVIRRYTDWPDRPTAWVELSGATLAARTAWDASVAIAHVVVWAPMWPWTGDVTVLRALCMGCVIRRWVDEVIGRHLTTPRPRQAKQATLWREG